MNIFASKYILNLNFARYYGTNTNKSSNICFPNNLHIQFFLENKRKTIT